MPDLSRRDALRSGAAALAGAALARPASAASPSMSGPLAGDVALVTGAARAIGRAAAIELARLGADVVVLDVADPDAFPFLPYPMASEADLDEAADLVRAQGRRALTVRADIRDRSALVAAVARAERELGPVSIAVANAGLVPIGPLLDLSDERWDAVVGVNLTGTANTLRAVLPGMVERGEGCVVAVSSTLGRQGAAINPDYVATKWGIIGLVKAAALEVGPAGVRVNAVAPGAVRTVRWPTDPEEAASLDQTVNDSVPLDVGVMEPVEIGRAVGYLCSPEAEYVSGIVLDVAAGSNASYTG